VSHHPASARRGYLAPCRVRATPLALALTAPSTILRAILRGGSSGSTTVFLAIEPLHSAHIVGPELVPYRPGPGWLKRHDNRSRRGQGSFAAGWR